MKPTALPPRGLYAITLEPAQQAVAALLDSVEQALLGGSRVIQFRDKGNDHRLRRQIARQLLALCRGHGVPLIINDDLQLAADIQADGVHLGRDDADPGAARRTLGAGAIIGVSCYNRLENALAAVAAGADYVAFGRFYSSATKPAAVQAEPDLLARAKRQLPVPVVAIGGITPENGDRLVQAGADFLAVIQGVFAAADIQRAAQRYQALFTD